MATIEEVSGRSHLQGISLPFASGQKIGLLIGQDAPKPTSHWKQDELIEGRTLFVPYWDGPYMVLYLQRKMFLGK